MSIDLVSDGLCELGDSVRVNVDLLENVREELIFFALLQTNQGKQLRLVVIEQFLGLVQIVIN